ncbi:ABC transporter permease [Paludibacterium sp.]|uniref:ABC transporter permease n=1 Tax=Paludibacterium sp. TaxID=1917523 RepID=UPI0025FF2C60|nr:ABC transporter permease [Paludibacterium sp.]MBV8646122.1 ABC transporter permease [Paludibacterium sp.]
MRMIVAMIWFDLKRFGQSPWRILFGLTQPLLYLFVLGAALRSGTYAEVADYQAYLYPGILGLALMFSAVSAAVGIVHEREVGFFRALLVAPVPRRHLAVGKVVAGAVLAFLQTLPLLPFAPVAGLGLTPVSLTQLVGAMFLSALVFSALGLALAMPFRSVLVFPVVSNALLLPMLFLSGALYPLDLAPDWIQLAARFDPAAYGIDLMRGAVSGQFAIAPGRSVLLLALCLLVAGVWVLARLRRAAEQ